MRTIKLTIAYDGTDLVGWQRQAAGRSVQGVLEEAFVAIEGHPVAVAGAGRTDAGVHAAGQVASAKIAHAIPAGALVGALNARLPDDVRVMAAEEAPDTFHARFARSLKTYHYRLCTTPAQPPLDRRTSWHVRGPLDLTAMAEAAASLAGEHDFAAFQAGGSAVRTTVRTITRSAACAEEGGIRYEVTGTGFLRHMVRTMVGTLVDVGRGRIGPRDMAAIVASRDRARAGASAPARGLVLVGIDYGPASAGLAYPHVDVR